MEDNSSIDLEAIYQQCGLETNVSSSAIPDIIEKIYKFDESYEKNNLVLIYNYILGHCKTPEILSEVVRCVDRIRDKVSLGSLVDLLLCKFECSEEEKEKFINVRVMCAKVIANLKDTSAVTALLYCLNNKNENYKVRFACADALGKIGDKYAVAPLIDVMKDEDEHSVYLKESAASALGMLGDMRAIDPLVSILETKQGIMDKFTFLKERVIEALGKLKFDDNRRVFNALKSSLMDESAQVRINAIEAIMDSDNPDSYDVIKRCLKDDNDEVKKNALIALYNLGGRKILDEVVSGEEYSDFLKMESVSMIEEYESEEVIETRLREDFDE